MKHWMLFSVCLLVSAASAFAQEPSKKAIIQRASDYLNGIHTIKASFVQVAPDGSLASGMFYLQKPGKMRWHYDPPVPVIMVSATGNFLRYYDYELEQVSDIPIKDTLAGFLITPNIDFYDESLTLLKVASEDGVETIRLTQRDYEDEGELAFEFSTQPYQLRNILLTDAKGEQTNISLNAAEYNIALDPELFRLKDVNFNKRKR